MWSRRGAIFALLSLLAACAPRSEDGAVTVMAAASLTDALDAVATTYTEQTGTSVRLAFASSSTAARQIEAGAPADVFVSANAAWMDYLAARGLVREDTRVSPITNRLVLIAPTNAPIMTLDVGPGFDLNRMLEDLGGPGARLSVGDPAHVPAGQYARAALETLGLWDAAAPRLAPALDVRGALALVERGEAPLGIVYATDAAVSDRVKVVGVFPDDSYPPIAYPFAMIAARDNPDAESFFAFATGEPGLAIFEEYGFVRR